MKLRNTIGNRRIVAIIKDLDGIIAHEEIAVKHNITIYNLKYLLRKMVDMGLIEITRVREDKGQLGASYGSILKMPEIETKEE